MNSLELTTTPKPASCIAPFNTVPIKELHRLIADIRRSRACFELADEATAEPESNEAVEGCDPRD
ncbi:hypothetical protein NA78x_004663 [Anatilimnocola sp. NA78]|uniref:hypothetical protein n=1 Tax=Anatilimnocola sp. NA78 TaxID=3415683 RepID=UPI003CE4DA02